MPFDSKQDKEKREDVQIIKRGGATIANSKAIGRAVQTLKGFKGI
jgi:hypothetical protein